jgi:5-(carboxyamino)imidazole ribonucleotide mutase
MDGIRFYQFYRCQAFPVATVALNGGAKNAGILAAQIIGSHDKEIMDKMIAYKLSLKEAVYKSSEGLKK